VQTLASKDANSGTFVNLAYTGTLTGGTGIVNLGSGQFYKDASGNVGVGTTTMTGKFNSVPKATYNAGGTTWAESALFVSGSYGGGLAMVDGTAGYGLNVESSGGAFVIRQGTVGSSPTERMRITSSGNLLVGTTSALADGKISSLATSSSQRPLGLSSNYSGDVGVSAIYITKFDNNSTTTQVFQQFAIGNGAAGSGQINANGANAAAFGSFSDSRLKENITDLPSQLAKIAELRPVEFDYIESEGGGHQIGFIAQEMKEVYPDAVGERTDGMLTVTGWSKTEARLVKAIQEQQALIENLTTRLNALEGK
jgi:hypothetical protein